ncbi:MAG: hypothetical protein OEW13_02615 [Nitrospira sp.]|nr:hypothetical protein [Nitrospira sp.]
MSHRAAIDNLGKEGIPQEVRDEFTAIPADRIEEVSRQPSIRTC